MKKDIERIKNILNKDKMNLGSDFKDFVSAEVGSHLSHFMNVKNCISKVNVDENGEYTIAILLKADTIY